MKKKIVEKNKVLESAAELFRVREDIIGFFEKEFLRLKVMYLKQKKKDQKKNRKKKLKSTLIILPFLLKKNQGT